MGGDHDRRPQGPRAASRHVGRPRARAVRPDSPRARTSGQRSSRPARSSASQQVGSRVYATNTLESGWIPARCLAIFTGDDDEGLPRVAAGPGLRGNRLARRQLLLRRHLRLLPDAVGARVRRSSSSSTTTSPAARRSRRWRQPKRQQGDARLERRRRRARDGDDVPEGATAPSTSTCRCPTTRPGRTTSC